jgi:hypothetical protein
MNFPATSDELRKGGYEYSNDARCSGCHEPIEWWLTPAGKKMPMTVQKAGDVLKASGEIRVPHWGICPNASDFRKNKKP